MSSQQSNGHRPSRLVEPRDRAVVPELTDDDQTLLWTAACRYFLGRMSYAVHDFCHVLVRAWPTLPHQTKALIQRDIEEQFERDDRARADAKDELARPLGMDIDRMQWERVRRLWR